MPGNYDANITVGAQIDTSEAEKGVQGLTGELGDALNKSAGQVSGASGAMQLALNAVSVAAGNMLTRVAEAAAGTVREMVSTGLEFNRQMENYQLAFENLLGSAEAANAALDAIKADAASTPFDVAGLVSANRLLISTGQSAEEAREVINALGNAVSASGGGNDELQRMAANLQQIANVGEAAAIDVKQFAYAGIDIYGLLADYTGKTREEVQGLTISYDLLAEALKAASAEGGRYAGAMEAYSQTLQGQMDTLADNATQALGLVTEGVHNALIPIVGDLAATLDEFTASVDWDAWSLEVQQAVTGAYSVIKTLIDFLLQNGKEVISLITGVATAFATWKIVGTVTAAVGTLTSAISAAGGLTAALGAVVAAINPVTAVLSVLAGAFGVAYSESEVFRDTVNAAVREMYNYCSGLLAELADTAANLWSSITTGTNKNDVRNDPEWLAAQAKNGNTQAGQQLQKVQRRNQAAALQAQADADREVDWDAVADYTARKSAPKATASTTDFAAALDKAASSAGKAAKQTETLADKLDDAHSALTASQSAYKTLSAAVEEYNETGTISLATWQDLMDLAPEYQALLVQEGEKLAIDQAAYNELTAAQRLEIETLAQANGVLPETIQLIDSLGIAAEEAADKTGTAFSELKEKLDGLTEDGPLAVIASLAGALKDGDWSGAAQAVAEGLWLTITPDQQDAIAGWAVQAVQAMNDGFASDGWAGLINAGATVVQGLAEGITSGQSVFVEAAQGLLSTFSGLGESILPAVGNAVTSLLGALNTLVPGIDLASTATAIFNAILDANPIILVISLLGMLGSALYGFAQTNTKVGETIRNIWDGIVNYIRTALKVVLSVVQAQFEIIFAAWNLFVKVAGKYLGLKEIHFNWLTDWLDPKEDNDEALEENTEAIKENTELIRNPPRYQSGGSGPTGGVTDYSAMLAAARAEVLAANGRVVTNYDAGSGQTSARLNASWHGTSTTVLELDGREVARAVTPYVDEDLAF